MKFPSLYEELFYACLRIRLVEERIMALYPSDKIQSPVHLSIGQEAVSVGVCHSLTPTDLVFGTYRSHALYLAKRGDMPQMFAELYGKRTGVAQGKAGSMHLTAPEVGFMGSSAVVASSIPHTVGTALAARRLGKDQTIVAMFGDGAIDEGVYHESINFAGVNKLPVLFVCENNGLAVHSRSASRHAFNILEHAESYGLPTSKIREGHDPVKVYEHVVSLVQEMKASDRPMFVEIETCRYMEHVGVGIDYTAGYRSEAEIMEWKERDPLIQDKATYAKYLPMVNAEVDEAVRFAEESPWPGIEDLLTDVE